MDGRWLRSPSWWMAASSVRNSDDVLLFVCVRVRLFHCLFDEFGLGRVGAEAVDCTCLSQSLWAVSMYIQCSAQLHTQSAVVHNVYMMQGIENTANQSRTNRRCVEHRCQLA